MKRLLLVRHAQSTAAAQGLTGGWTDVPLCDSGREQALRLAERLAAEVPEGASLFSSDLERAAATARALAERLALEPVLEAGLRELDNGAAAGLALARARACLDRLTARSEPTAIVVTHGNSGVVALKGWLRLPDETPIHLGLDCASLSELTTNAWGERTVVRLNDTRHLAGS